MKPPPRNNRTRQTMITIRLKLRPPLRDESAPSPNPSTAISSTPQFIQPSSGTNAGIASTSATSPTRNERMLSMAHPALVAAWLQARRRARADQPTLNLSRSEEHTSELQSLMRISYAVFCLKKKNEEHIDQIQTLTNKAKRQSTKP